MDLNFTAFRPFGGADEGEPLRALDWSGLVARLGAERDLRRELVSRVGAPVVGDASFAAGAASVLGSVEPGEPGVNPETLNDSKPNGGIASEAGTAPSAAGNEARGQQ